MHRSRLCGFVIDCQGGDVEGATRFWSQALGRPVRPMKPESERCRQLATEPAEPMIFVQTVAHPSRIHLDIEADDIEAEVKRLEALGARRVEFVKRWWVMEAPTGQRFCVAPPQEGPPQHESHVNVWSNAGEMARSAHPNIATVERRVDAIQSALHERGLKANEAVEQFAHLAEEQWVPRNGARLVAKAWSDPAFRRRLLANGIDAVAELGLAMPRHHRHLVVLENTPKVQNVICCTLCSCTAFTIIGLPPDWYKDFEYRSRIVRQSRTVLKEMGLDLPADVEIRVWDTTADTRYIVLPVQPPETIGWTEEKLAEIVTRDGMIGVARL